MGLAELENLADGANSLRKTLAEAALEADSAIAGAVVLATCNRLEIYVDAVRFHDAVDTVTESIVMANGMDADHAESALRVRVGGATGSHLFAVAAGLDAMVVGEAEIAGQVAKAHRKAASDGTLTPQLDRLFRSASRTAKAVAAQTRLGAEGRSVASVALDIAAGRIGDLAGRRALIVGTGAYARVLAASLRARGCTALWVFSPSGRAEAFAATHHATAVTADALAAVLADIDLLVAASGRGGIADEVRLDSVTAALRDRERPVLVVDLALHHDIPAPIRELGTVEVIDLHSVASTAGSAHGSELRLAQEIVLQAVDRFESEVAERTIDPAVVALRSHVFAAVDAEVKRLRRKYDGQVADDVERAMRRATSSLLHTPTMRAKELARGGSGEDYIKALHTLFGIEIPRS